MHLEYHTRLSVREYISISELQVIAIVVLEIGLTVDVGVNLFSGSGAQI